MHMSKQEFQVAPIYISAETFLKVIHSIEATDKFFTKQDKFFTNKSGRLFRTLIENIP